MDETLITSEQLTASRSYYHDALTWCVQIKQPISNWKNIFYLCRDPLVFAIYTVMCTLVIFMGYFLQIFENITPKWDWFRLTFAGVSPCLGFASEYFANTIPNRIFFLFSLFGATLSFIVFNAFFLLFVTFPIYEHQINTRQEIIDNRFELIGDAFAFQHLKLQNDQVNANQICQSIFSISVVHPQESLAKFKICEDLNVCLKQLNQNQQLAIAISREHVRNSHSNLHVFCFEQSDMIYDYALKFLVRKDFPYLNEFNEFIRMTSARGLIKKWHSERIIRYQNK